MILPGKPISRARNSRKPILCNFHSLCCSAWSHNCLHFTVDGFADQTEASATDIFSWNSAESADVPDLLNVKNLSEHSRFWGRGVKRHFKVTIPSKKILPVALSQLMILCCEEYNYKCIKKQPDQDEFRFTTESAAAGVTSPGHRSTIDNLNRFQTFSFYYLGNVHVYLFLTTYTFSKFICDCIGTDKDRYSLQK